MSTRKHYFVEQMPDGRYALRAKGAQEASGIFPTQQDAIERIEELNQCDHPAVERVRNVSTGGRDQWRSKD
jgi:hypothetical protein